jgi:DNA-binding NarL/FixJ family response regulator
MAVDGQRTRGAEYAVAAARVLCLAAGLAAVGGGGSAGFVSENAPTDQELAIGVIVLALLGAGGLWLWARYTTHAGSAAAVWWPRRKRRQRVMVVDAHPVVREGIRAMVRSAPDLDVVAEAADEDEAVRVARAAQPDVLVLGPALPGLAGAEAVRRLRQALPDLPIVVLTTSQGKVVVGALARVGVAGLVPKTAGAADVLATVRAAAAGQRAVHAALGDLERGRSGIAAGVDHELGPTSREQEVLHLLAAGLSDQQMAERMCVGKRTVRFHLGNLFDELDAKNRNDLLRRARDAGWLDRD